MPRAATAADVIAAVRDLDRHHPQRTVYVGIDGFGAAGKTSLADGVRRALPRAQVVHVDDFARPGVPEWEWDRFEQQVAAPLRAGTAAHYQVWNWDDDLGGPWRTVEPGVIVVVEGVSATRQEVCVAWDLTVWVDAPRALRLRRAVERDGPEMLDTWLTLWMPPEQAYAEREAPQQRVDLLVDGTARPAGVDAPDLGHSGT